MESLLKLGQLSLELNTGSYQSSSARIILFATRLLARTAHFLLYFIDHTELHQQGDSAPDLQYLEDVRAKYNAFLLDQVRAVLDAWEEQTQKASDLSASCVMNAHMALLYRGVRDSELGSETAGPLLAHLSFLTTWFVLAELNLG